MILRRISTLFKEQNWSAVTIEILVVIVGIFLGMQATNWNDERKARLEELQYLESLKSDLAQVQSAIESARSQHRFLMNNGLLLVRYLKGEIPFEAHSGDIMRGLLMQFQLPMPQLKIGELGVLMERQGPIQVSMNEERNRILALIDEMNKLSDIYKHIELYIDSIQEGYMDKFSPAVGGYLQGYDNVLLDRVYDLEALKSDQAFLISFQNILYRHEMSILMLDRMDKAITEYLQDKDHNLED